MKHLIYIFCFLLFSVNWADCLVVGSNTVPSRQAKAIFPAADSDNTLLGFAAFESGFTLRSHTTTCTFNDFLPVSGAVDLRGGQLYLLKDLVFDKDLSLTSSGIFWGGGFSLEFGKLIPDLILSSSFMFDSLNVTFNTDAKINGPLQFRKDCKITGRKKRLSLQGNSEIIVRAGASLLLDNVEIKGLKKNNLRCMTDAATITLRNCILSLAQDFTFSRGSLLLQNDVIITGTNKFIYTTGMTTSISSGAVFFLDRGITVSYAPRRPYRNLLYMTDNTSRLYLNGCTLHSTRTGLQLQTGTVILDDKITFSSEARNSGEALCLSSNLTTMVLGGAYVDMFGLIRYD